MFRTTIICLAACSLLWISACGEALHTEDPLSSTTQSLVLQELGGGLEGVFIEGDKVVQFRSIHKDNQFEIFVELNGMTLRSHIVQNQFIEVDGFTTENGDETLINEDDKALMMKTIRAIENRLYKELKIKKETPAEDKLIAVMNIWAEYPPTLELTKKVQIRRDRSYSSLCSKMNTYVKGSHDCQHGGWWSDKTTINNVLVSYHSGGSCKPDKTFFKNTSSGTWTCYEPDHKTNVEYMKGLCPGRCGAGCGSGNLRFTYDCLHHDVCVRVGHTAGSMRCNDEFTATFDDAVSAPKCPR